MIFHILGCLSDGAYYFLWIGTYETFWTKRLYYSQDSVSLSKQTKGTFSFIVVLTRVYTENNYTIIWSNRPCLIVSEYWLSNLYDFSAERLPFTPNSKDEKILNFTNKYYIKWKAHRPVWWHEYKDFFPHTN